ncbi:hypothetical protein FDF12_03320 [Clostridium botulinum]|nr:hypothetical protein [Clostridium botulinum]NFS52933.1 hypothetical protein [Clostridium botulinum]NFT16455.1 hypothetical protein [Clostridium botulinum]
MNIQELQTERLDINNKYNVELVCKQLDDVILKIIVYDKNLPADLSNYNVRLKAFKVDQVPIIQNTNIIIKDNIVTIKADKQLTTTEGIVKAELQFINKTTLEKKSTFYLEIEVVASVLAVDGTVSIPTCTLLEELDNKLDEIENIGNVLEEAKVVRDDLEEKTITGTTLKTDLNTNIETGTQLKTDLTELIPQANKSKSDLDTSKINADLSNTTLTETTNNAEIKKQEVISECKVADEKIKQMNEFGDATEVVKDVTLLKTEITTARDNETDLNTRLERDKTNILKTIGDLNILSTTEKANLVSALNEILGITNQLSNPNLLINGDFQVWQRGTEQLVDFNGTSYCADRWKVHQLNVLQSKQLTNDSRLSKYCLRVENKNTSGTQLYLTQPFEDDYIDFLNDKLVTVSFWIKGYNNATNVLYYEVGNKQVDKVYLTNEWQKVSGTVKANFVKDNINMRGITIFTAGSNPILTNQGYEISNIKLELGSVATPFVPRPYGEELALCQRYYQSNYITGWFSGSVTTSGNYVVVKIPLPTTLRLKPTLINDVRGTMQYYNGGWINLNNVVVSAFTNNVLTLNSDLPSGASNGGIYLIKFIPSFDAEIY